MRDPFFTLPLIAALLAGGCETTPRKGKPDWPDVTTAEHEARVEEVRTGLLRGQAYYDIADYDAAEREYRGVLLIDPSNEGAKSGLYMAQRAKEMVQGTNALDWGRRPY